MISQSKFENDFVQTYSTGDGNTTTNETNEQWPSSLGWRTRWERDSGRERDGARGPAADATCSHGERIIRERPANLGWLRRQSSRLVGLQECDDLVTTAFPVISGGHFAAVRECKGVWQRAVGESGEQPFRCGAGYIRSMLVSLCRASWVFICVVTNWIDQGSESKTGLSPFRSEKSC